tara:strand:- start:7475 stop:8164 length:690 start_codon:yes stop_codon:yes gene_type:complete
LHLLALDSKLFKNIIDNNQLINGKLNLSYRELEKLYFSLKKKEARYKDRLTRKYELIQSNLDEISNLKNEIKYIKESINKITNLPQNKIALLYKKLGNNNYVKARIYWNGKQREVQVGTISNILRLIPKIKSKINFDTSTIIKENISWEKIKKEPQLIELIKFIASLKFQEYLIRKLKDINNKKSIKTKSEQNKVKENDFIDTDINKDYIESSDDLSKWYINWREKNLR